MVASSCLLDGKKIENMQNILFKRGGHNLDSDIKHRFLSLLMTVHHIFLFLSIVFFNLTSAFQMTLVSFFIFPFLKFEVYYTMHKK